MRLAHALEFTAAIAVGLGLIRFRATGPDYNEFCPTILDRVIDGADVFFAGAAIVFGAAIANERGKKNAPLAWGLGRWVWFAGFIYVMLKMLERLCDSLSHRLLALQTQTSWTHDVFQGLRGKYSGFALPGVAWMILTFLICRVVAPCTASRHARDAIETSGRVFALLLILMLLAMKVLLFLGYNQGGMGGGFAGG